MTLRDDLTAARAEDAQFQELIRDHERLIRELKAKQSANQEKIKHLTVELRREDNRAREAAEAAERQRLLQEEADRQRAQFEQLSLSFDEVSTNAPWLGRAKQHQLIGGKFLAVAKRALCADGMGVGKTLQALMWADYLQIKRLLVICPGDVMGNFVRESDRWTERMITVIGRAPKVEARRSLRMIARSDEPSLTIINYEAWNKNRSILDDIAATQFDGVVLDEAHAIKELNGVPYKGVSTIINAANSCPRCRGPLSVRDYITRCVKNCGWQPYESGDRRSVQYLLCMTGTPVLNRPQEIFPMLHLINEEVFPSERVFLRDYCEINDDSGKWTWKPGGLSHLAKLIQPFYLRRTMLDAGVELPPQSTTIHEIEFDEELYPKQAEIMRMIRQYNMIQVEDKSLTIASLLALITRERQAAVWPGGISLRFPVEDEEGNPIILSYKDDGTPVYETELVHVGDNYRESIKIDKAVELIEELNSSGHRVVVFSQFKEALKELETRLTSVVRYDGDTNQEARRLIEQDFNREELGDKAHQWDTILCNYKTGGVGLNLTAATAIIVLDEEWNPGKNEQAYARIHRMGQTEATQVHILRVIKAPSNIDAWLSMLINEKAKTVDGFNETAQRSLLLKGLLGEDL